MWGLGKKRTKLGKFLDKHGRTQQELAKAAGVNKETVSKACSDPDYSPTVKTLSKLMKALRKLDSNVKAEDFFDI
ncbi:helix-turn-helix transcriptional regulator [Priestia koreensis]|uniref:XRE family transcriptional regulator n=1 Tax=Priestia koreensis TaxID=284581 RepID=A0A0M0L698_9BACI|nr:helix-turn-helix transcriptional regulator [Priestia koreensis]KOO46392.1 XRE family transcriptional regulator [Priestia koreensis]